MEARYDRHLNTSKIKCEARGGVGNGRLIAGSNRATNCLIKHNITEAPVGVILNVELILKTTEKLLRLWKIKYFLLTTKQHAQETAKQSTDNEPYNSSDDCPNSTAYCSTNFCASCGTRSGPTYCCVHYLFFFVLSLDKFLSQKK